MRSRLALFTLVAAIGCGDIVTVNEDAAPGQSDAAGEPDAGNPGDPLNGTWVWWIGDDPENPDSTCDVTIGGGEYEVYCGSDPVVVATDCTRTKSDIRITGSWTGEFAGSFDEIRRYEGVGCTGDYLPTDSDIVTEDILFMEAPHSTASQASGFLELAYGVWSWEMWEADAADDRFGCEVSFEPGESQAVAFRVECAQEPSTPIPDCTQTDFLIIEGEVNATTMTSEGWDEDHYEGSGCDPDYPDPVVEGEHTPMGADKQ